ncbi:MAG: hypothetical protein ONA90_05930 [candidate division KSB1 bacterium]|nr:hypothetical protein [candidate division KSB1 bacterium]
MANRLLTIEGFYDGKMIQPLVKLKTRKRSRVLITFLEEVDDFADLKKHSEKVFAKLWQHEDDEIWSSYL